MVLGPEDLVISRNSKGGTAMAGFPLKALAAERGEPAVLIQGGGGRNPVKLEGLAVPCPLAVSSTASVRRPHEEEEGGVASDALMEQLAALASLQRPARPKRMTRHRRASNSKRKSRRRARKVKG